MSAGAGARRLAVGLWLVVLAVCALVVSRASFTADMSAFLPKAPTPEQQLLVEQLSDGLVSRLVLVGIEGATPAQRNAVSRKLADILRGDPQFVAVANGESTSMDRDQALLFANRYALSPAVDAKRFTVEGLRNALQDTLDLLASPAGLIAKGLLTRDPTGEIVNLIEQLGAQSATAQNRPRTEDGIWVSRDASRAVLLLQTRAVGGDTDAQQAAVGAVQAAFAQARQATGADAQLRLAGPGVFGVQVRQQIEREVTRLSIAGTSLIVLLLLVLYRSLPALVLGLLPVASGVLVAVAVVALGFGAVHGLTLGFGTTLIGEAVDYSIYLFVQSRHAGANRDEWLRRFWPTVRLGVLTSLFGFASLLFSGFPGLAQLGLYSIAGLVTAALVTRFVLPHLLPAGFMVRDISGPGRVLAHAVARAGVLRWPALLAAVACVLVLALRHDTLWNHELSALNPTSAADQALDQSLRADLGAPDVRFLVVVTAPTQEGALQAAERAAAALQPLAQRNTIGGIDSPSQLLPSMATQQARLASIPPVAELRERLREALKGMPIDAQRLEPFLADAGQARTARPIQRAALDGTTLAVGVDGMLVQRSVGGQAVWRAFLPLHGPRAAAGQVAAQAAAIDPALIRAALTQARTDALVVDLKGEADALYVGYLREAFLLSLGGLAAIAVLVAVALRSPLRMLRVMAPLACAELAVVAGLALAGEQLTILHLIGLLLVAAVGSNYALFFDSAHGSTPEPTTLASLLFANVSAVLGFGILALSSVPVLHAIGITVGPGAVLALVLAAVFAAPPRSGGRMNSKAAAA